MHTVSPDHIEPPRHNFSSQLQVKVNTVDEANTDPIEGRHMPPQPVSWWARLKSRLASVLKPAVQADVDQGLPDLDAPNGRALIQTTPAKRPNLAVQSHPAIFVAALLAGTRKRIRPSMHIASGGAVQLPALARFEENILDLFNQYLREAWLLHTRASVFTVVPPESFLKQAMSGTMMGLRESAQLRVAGLVEKELDPFISSEKGERVVTEQDRAALFEKIVASSLFQECAYRLYEREKHDLYNFGEDRNQVNYEQLKRKEKWEAIEQGLRRGVLNGIDRYCGMAFPTPDTKPVRPLDPALAGLFKQAIDAHTLSLALLHIDMEMEALEFARYKPTVAQITAEFVSYLIRQASANANDAEQEQADTIAEGGGRDPIPYSNPSPLHIDEAMIAAFIEMLVGQLPTAPQAADPSPLSRFQEIKQALAYILAAAEPRHEHALSIRNAIRLGLQQGHDLAQQDARLRNQHATQIQQHRPQQLEVIF